MRFGIAAVWIVAVLLVTVPAFGASSPVPTTVQRAIPTMVPAYLRYMPTELPLGYGYAKWHGTRTGLEISFARKGRPATLVFFAAAAGPKGTCSASGMHTYRVGSMRVSFENDRYDEQFWRCIRAGTVTLEATIRRTDGLTASRQRAVAAMVASATHLG